MRGWASVVAIAGLVYMPAPTLSAAADAPLPAVRSGGPPLSRWGPSTPWNGGSPPEPPAVRLAAALRNGASVDEIMAIREELLLGGDVSRYPAPAGDLDGDGLDDLVTIEPLIPDTGQHSLRARRGTDGSELWLTRLDGFSVFAVDDLDSDGRPDVAIFENLASDVPGPSSITPGVTQNVRVLDGRDGSLKWERPVPGGILPANAGDARVTAMAGIVVSFETVPDADGDGSRDVALGTITTAEVRTPHVPSSQVPPGVGSHERRRSAFTLDILSGRSGAPAGRASAEGVFAEDCEPGGSCERFGGMPWLLATPDMSGDGRADAAALSYTATSGLLQALPLDGGGAFWSAPVAVTPYAELGRAQLDGAGGADVLITLYDRGPLSVTGHSGADGSRLLSRSLAGDNGWFLLGDVDRDGGEDVAVSTLAGYVHEVRFTALRGASGETLWTSVHGGTRFRDVVRWGPSRDLTGDGVVDVPVQILVDRLAGATTNVVAKVVNGRDGTVVWTHDRPDLTIPSVVNGDVNGNGSGDLISSLRAGGMMRVRLEDGATGTTLWSADVPSPHSDDRLWTWFGADVVASGADEVVVSLVSFFDGLRQRPSAVGPGGVIWTL